MKSSNTLRINGNNRILEIPMQVGNYNISKMIGRGSFAVVLIGFDIHTNKRVAIKVIDREEITRHGITKYTENELRIHSKLSHPNIAKIYDIVYLKDVILIVMEYCMMGDLYSFVQRSLKFSQDDLIRITYELFDALSYIHKRGIVHRDIKAENIMFDENFHPKLIDFGLAREEAFSESTFVGTFDYIAPEMFKGEEYDGKKSDIWAMGVSIHVMATGHLPWRYQSTARHVRDARQNNIELVNDATGILGEIIDKCLQQNPSERPASEELQKLTEYVPEINYKDLNTTDFRKFRSETFTRKRIRLVLTKPNSEYFKCKNSARICFPSRNHPRQKMT